MAAQLNTAILSQDYSTVWLSSFGFVHMSASLDVFARLTGAVSTW